MESKASILKAIREFPLPEAPLPELSGDFGIVYKDPIAQFGEVLASVGGRAICVADESALPRAVSELDVCRDGKQVFSRVPDVVAGNVDLEIIEDPRELNNLDLAVLPGELAVAENAAVWVTDEGIRHRTVFFIAEHLMLVVRAETMVHNMHQAYERLDFEQPQYGLFISGPSKTADIEQSLVIGAQGPRSLHVLIVGACEPV